MTTPSAPRVRFLAVLALLVPLVAACSSQAGGSGQGIGVDTASCAAVIEYRGKTYVGHGDLKRDPATTGRHLTAVMPGCDDTGGQEPAPRERAVRIAELVDVPLHIAFRWHDSIFVRDGRSLPASTRAWFRAPDCATESTFRLFADWLGVTGPKKPRFDGDIRAPFRIQVHVTAGPAEYVGATVWVWADAATEPTLHAEDVKASLWKGGQVTARVRCDAGRFQAISLRVPARA